MARLLVFRGETLDREIEVGRETFRIGRGEQNDLILEDRGKAVSRNHAEIRYEGGRYVLADLESQNGIWVAGNRVPFVVLDPKIVASVGPYRLMLEVDPPTDAAFAIPEGAALDSNDYAELAKTQVRPVEPIARVTPKPPPPPVTAGPKTPVPKVAAVKPAPKGPATAKGPSTTTWLIAGGAAVLVLLLAIVIVRVARGPSAPVDTTGPQVQGMIADARRLIEQGDCAGALTRAIEPALSLQPGNAEVQTLKTTATACVPAPAPPQPPPPQGLTPEEITAHLQSAADAIGRKECEPALTEHITKVLEQDPSNQQALDLKLKAETCGPKTPVAPAAPTVKLAVVIPPDRGGLEPNSGELDKDYQVRVKAMRTRYDEALATLASGSTARAITALEGIARDAGSRYLEVTPKLTEARKAVAAQALAEARDFEAKNEYDQAIARFQRVAALDHDAKVDEDIRRVQEKKRQLGLKACEDAKNAYAFNRGQQALQFYQQVIKLLPENDPCFATAKQRIAELGGR